MSNRRLHCRLGTEHEKLVFLAGTHDRAPYDSIAHILRGLVDRHGWEARFEDGNIVGAKVRASRMTRAFRQHCSLLCTAAQYFVKVREVPAVRSSPRKTASREIRHCRHKLCCHMCADNGHIVQSKDGASVTLEPGGQLELSSAPLYDLHATADETKRHLDQVLICRRWDLTASHWHTHVIRAQGCSGYAQSLLAADADLNLQSALLQHGARCPPHQMPILQWRGAYAGKKIGYGGGCPLSDAGLRPNHSYGVNTSDAG